MIPKILKLFKKNLLQVKSQAAAFLSILFSPFIVIIVAVFLLVRIYAETIEQFILWFLTSVLFIVILPFLFIYILARLGKLADIYVVRKEQRFAPLLFSLFSALVGILILYSLGARKEVMALGISYIVNGVVFILITPFWKISLHCGVVAGCITVLADIVTPQMAILFLLVPPVAWARIHRKRHTSIQTISGAIIAVLITKLTLLIF